MTDDPHPNMSAQPGPTDAPSLINDAVQRGTRLIQNEIELAKRELAQKASRAAIGLVMVLAAIFLVFSALDVLTAAAVVGLAEAGLPVTVSSIIIAAVVFAVATGLFIAGKARLDPGNLTLKKSRRNLRKDINTIKESAHV